MSSFGTQGVQTFSIAVSLVASGGIATLSLFDVPQLQAQPASRSLPSLRWLFSRGSHLFPQAALSSGAGFLYLAYADLAPGARVLSSLLGLGSNSAKVNLYLAAAALSVSIAPFTRLVMVPTNFELIKMNEEKGGSRSSASARKTSSTGEPDYQPGQRSAADSVKGRGEPAEFTDLSGPQRETPLPSTPEEDEKVVQLLGRFGKMNMIRAVLLGAGGLVGLWTSLQ